MSAPLFDLAAHASEAKIRAAIVLEARSWLRTPYHHLGRIRGVGVDCAMLLAEVYESVGLIPHLDPEYVPDWHLHRNAERYLQQVEQYCGRVDVPQAGDIAVWKFGRTFSHGAIVVAPGQVIHAYRNRPVELASMTEQHLAARPCVYYSWWARNGR